MKDADDVQNVAEGSADEAIEAATEPAADPAVDPAAGKRVFKLLQGYVWHPRDEEVDLAEYLPEEIGTDVRVLWDPLPRAPFTFFDDGTLAETQVVYQLTVMAFLEEEDEPGRQVPWLAETLQAKLETTPEGVGWQIMEDLRELAR